ncbi:hypothetical protein [Nocardioides baekrokdamisoli]|uniref:hypothetical protein n=1 Tax=Nocardioides baekrokdamisoli TaxID=1804624 RepID=UPI000F79398C|nr:hypothetical protein [Nocardioides baekrokdamisoli]
MTSTKFSPLHLEAPRLVADVALGEHLAALARASAPSGTSRVRRSGWRVPLAAIATIAASGSVAYAGQAALHSEIRPAAPAVPVDASITEVAATAADATAAAAGAAVRSPRPTHPHGKIVGRGHPKTGRALGHPGKHDAGNHGAHNPDKATPSGADDDMSPWRKSAGTAGTSTP